jgi:predicted site-specific integrase-resolvase
MVTELASGLNDTRPKLTALLKDKSVGVIVVEHKERLTRFGFNYIVGLLQLPVAAGGLVNGWSG